ncbi:hypothetical protein G7047_10475 [Diaphorobacter sp. HDW4A]|uniref:hypothetical protein n=1 Tax=Diaphorobacter sp. HDW4A TaxID=2714924 RepID=UPI00140E4F68|nr:hypothetical protein [Diaphorobacter sp. HDW4A]QIL80279.1 hypothetical protein G7047_10475 [Diaphorobacter sp. HDW4A]
MCWLMLALVLSPALGLVHKVVHGSGLPAPLAIEVVAQFTQSAGEAAAPQSQEGLHGLFGAHTKSECVLLDQIALGHALMAHALPVAQPLPAALPVADVPAPPLGQHAAPFRARGPPSLLLA